MKAAAWTGELLPAFAMARQASLLALVLKENAAHCCARGAEGCFRGDLLDQIRSIIVM